MGSEGSTSPAAGGACAVCGGAAAVYCAADGAALCVPCDASVHAANPLASRHDRVPLAAAVAAASGVYNLFAADDADVASSWLAPPAQAQGSPHGSSSTSYTTSDSGAEGRSLFDLLSDVDLAAACVTGGPAGHLPDGVAPVHHGAAPLWAHSGLAAWTTTWSAAQGSVSVPATAAAVVAAAADREARVRRYREKRKNRKFQKTIRYESRKAYAEARPRIKGRFVKRTAGGAAAAASDDDGTASASGAADAGDAAKFWLSFSDDARDHGVGFYMDATGYGVVPSF